LILLGGEVVLEADSAVQGQVFLYGGHLTIKGHVWQDVHAYGGQLFLANTGVLSGNVALVGAQLSRAEGAQVAGQISTGLRSPLDIRLPPVKSQAAQSLFVSLWWRSAQTLALTALAMLVAVVAPRATERAGDAATGRPWQAGGLGLLVALVTPPLLLGLTITLIGIPITMLLAMLAVCLQTFGWIALGLEVGKRLAASVQANWPPLIQASLGTLLLSLVAQAFGLAPCVGWIVPALVGFVGMGGVLLSGLGRRPAPSSLSPAIQPAA
jgi:predicted RecA/RadA family phage recombinase